MLARRYAGLTSYRDTGLVRSAGTRSVIRFLTSFQRPDRFCFEFTAPGRTISWGAVWQQHGQTYWRDGEQMEPVPEIMDAMAHGTGATLGAAHTIPALLLPQIARDDWTVRVLRQPHRVPAPTPEFPSAWIWIEGGGWHDDQVVRVAIDSTSGLLVRCDDITPGHEYQTQYLPYANPALSERDFTLIWQDR